MSSADRVNKLLTIEDLGARITEQLDANSAREACPCCGNEISITPDEEEDKKLLAEKLAQNGIEVAHVECNLDAAHEYYRVTLVVDKETGALSVATYSQKDFDEAARNDSTVRLAHAFEKTAALAEAAEKGSQLRESLRAAVRAAIRNLLGEKAPANLDELKSKELMALLDTVSKAATKVGVSEIVSGQDVAEELARLRAAVTAHPAALAAAREEGKKEGVAEGRVSGRDQARAEHAEDAASLDRLHAAMLFAAERLLRGRPNELKLLGRIEERSRLSAEELIRGFVEGFGGMEQELEDSLKKNARFREVLLGAILKLWGGQAQAEHLIGPATQHDALTDDDLEGFLTASLKNAPKREKENFAQELLAFLEGEPSGSLEAVSEYLFGMKSFERRAIPRDYHRLKLIGRDLSLLQNKTGPALERLIELVGLDPRVIEDAPADPEKIVEAINRHVVYLPEILTVLAKKLGIAETTVRKLLLDPAVGTKGTANYIAAEALKLAQSEARLGGVVALLAEVKETPPDNLDEIILYLRKAIRTKYARAEEARKQAEWDALPLSEKVKRRIANFMEKHGL